MVFPRESIHGKDTIEPNNPDFTPLLKPEWVLPAPVKYNFSNPLFYSPIPAGGIFPGNRHTHRLFDQWVIYQKSGVKNINLLNNYS